VDAFQADDKIQALVQYSRERTGRVERNGTEYWLDLVVEVAAQPGQLLRVPACAADETNVVGFQRRNQLVIEQPVLLVNEFMCLLGNRVEHLVRGEHVGPGGRRSHFEALLQTADANFKELVEIGRNDAQELEAFQQRRIFVRRFI